MGNISLEALANFSSRITCPAISACRLRAKLKNDLCIDVLAGGKLHIAINNILIIII
jgi:hypothetical protein